MSRLNDAIESLERELNKYEDDDAESLLNRRFVIREAMYAWGREEYREGHRDGMQDQRDARREAQRRADKAAADGLDDAVMVSRADVEQVLEQDLPGGVRDRLKAALEECNG